MFIGLRGVQRKKLLSTQEDLKLQIFFPPRCQRVNFQTPIFAFSEGQHTFSKRYIERRTAKEYSTVSTAGIKELTAKKSCFEYKLWFYQAGGKYGGRIELLNGTLLVKVTIFKSKCYKILSCY